MNTPDWQTALRSLLKESEIVDDSAALLTDQRRRYTGQADLVVQPQSVAAVQAVMKFCHEHSGDSAGRQHWFVRCGGAGRRCVAQFKQAQPHSQVESG